MKLVKACLSARNDRENSVHNWGGAGKFVLACLSTRKHRESSFNLGG